MMQSVFVVAAVGAAASFASAATLADIAITEVYTGTTGEDGTADWIEITNFGTGSVTLDGLIFDDVSASTTAGDVIPTVTIAQGESIILLIDIGSNATPQEIADEIADFQSVWDVPTVQVIATDGGGFGQGGDSAFILQPNGDIVTGATFGASTDGFTFEFLPFGNINTPVLSSIGTNGAFESNAFFNDDIGGANNSITLVGSPGTIPTPGALALAGIAGLGAARRRR
ncbi:MAG: lamin tail domain-containing protein [Planctomycetota bacterium]